MAIVKNVLLQGIRGKVGNKVYREIRGKTFVQAAPIYNKNRIPSRNELETRVKFSKATAFARRAMITWDLRAVYEKAKKSYRKMTPFGIAVRNAMQNPTIMVIDTGRYTGLPGSTIKVRADDFVKVTEVTVTIATAEGVLIEQGAAHLSRERSFDWIYETSQVNNELEGCKVIVVAKNLPGNEGIMESVIAKGSKQKRKK